jgi:hypothetical protein
LVTDASGAGFVRPGPTAFGAGGGTLPIDDFAIGGGGTGVAEAAGEVSAGSAGGEAGGGVAAAGIGAGGGSFAGTGSRLCGILPISICTGRPVEPRGVRSTVLNAGSAMGVCGELGPSITSMDRARADED